MDSGNTARAANWRRMIDHTNQLVVPVTAIEDRAEAARLTLQTLESRGGHDAELARNAVVIVSESTDAKRSMSGDALKRAKDEAQRIADGFAPVRPRRRPDPLRPRPGQRPHPLRSPPARHPAGGSPQRPPSPKASRRHNAYAPHPKKCQSNTSQRRHAPVF